MFFEKKRRGKRTDVDGLREEVTLRVGMRRIGGMEWTMLEYSSGMEGRLSKQRVW